MTKILTILLATLACLCLTGCVTPATGSRSLSDRGGGGNNAGFNNWENTQNLDNPHYVTHNHYNAPGEYIITGAPGGAGASGGYHATGGMHAINVHQDDSQDNIAAEKTVEAGSGNSAGANVGSAGSRVTPTTTTDRRTAAPEPSDVNETSAPPEPTAKPDDEATTRLAAELDKQRRRAEAAEARAAAAERERDEILDAATTPDPAPSE